MSTIINKYPGESSDDVTRRLAGDSWDMVGGLEVGYSSAAWGRIGSGIRFLDITVPKGDIIIAAYLTLKCSYSRDLTIVKCRISAEKEDNPATFADNKATFDTRWANRTTERVDWDNIGAWVQNTSYNSPDIKDVIQEITDRPGWASGQALVIFWEDFEDRSTHASQVRRTAYAWDYGDGANKAILTIEYSAPAAAGRSFGFIFG